MAQGGDLRVLLGALAGVGLGGVVLLAALPLVAPLERARPVAAPDPVAPDATGSAPATAPAATVSEADPAAAPTRVAVPEAAPVPSFDTVRVSPDGSGLVAGQADPGATVSVLAGEGVAAEVTADAEGRFVAFLDLPASAEPRALSLRDAAGGISEETVIVAPTGAEAVADPAPPGERAGTTQEERAATPEAGRATAEATGPATRDLPSDRPTPSLAPAEGPVAALPRIGPAGEAVEPPTQEPAAEVGPGEPSVEIASAEPAPGEEPALGDGPESLADYEVASAVPPEERLGLGSQEAIEPADAVPAPDADLPDTAPEVASADPADVAAPVQGDVPEASAAPAEAPRVVAVTGPVPAAPDDLPEHGPPPTLADAPGSPLPPESGAPGQAAVLVSDAEGVRVIQPALPPGADAETLATVALDAIAYGGEGQVLLSGRASGGGTVRLYLDNALVAEGPVGADGQWSASLDGAEEGTFTLRLDQLDAAGEVASRMEMPFRREARSDLAALMAEAQEAGQTIAMRTVQPGNTLWAIARDRYGEPLMYVRVYEMNRDRIRDPDLIYPGQVFVLPATAGR